MQDRPLYCSEFTESDALIEAHRRNILVTGGMAKEILDGVRHYANDSRPENHGHCVAAALHALGAKVTFVTPQTSLAAPENVKVISSLENGRAIVSAADVVEACERACAAENFDIFLHLASFASLKPAERAMHKMKVKKDACQPVLLDVVANVDAFLSLEEAKPGIAYAGYDNAQNFRAKGLPAGLWKGFVDRHLHKQRVVAGNPRHPSASPLKDLLGMKIVVSSGPTVEQLTLSGDIVTNFSTGAQGHSVACALADRGADVILVSGPVVLPDPVHPSIRTLHVRSAKEMMQTCVSHFPVDAYVGVAAVADFGLDNLLRPISEEGHTQIHLSQNPDILMSIGKHPSSRPGIVIGFAAETANLEAYAREKLKKKGAEVLFANYVGRGSGVSSSNRNHVLRVTEDETRDCGEMDKYQVGLLVADFIASRRHHDIARPE